MRAAKAESSSKKEVSIRGSRKGLSFPNFQEILEKKARESSSTVTAERLVGENGKPYIALKRLNQSSSSSNPTNYEARFSETSNGEIQAEIVTTSGKTASKADENFKNCLIDVLDVFSEANVPVVNLDGELIKPNSHDAAKRATTYEILKDAIQARKSIPVLQGMSVLQSLQFFNQQLKLKSSSQKSADNPVLEQYIQMILKNSDLRKELKENLKQNLPADKVAEIDKKKGEELVKAATKLNPFEEGLLCKLLDYENKNVFSFSSASYVAGLGKQQNRAHFQNARQMPAPGTEENIPPRNNNISGGKTPVELSSTPGATPTSPLLAAAAFSANAEQNRVPSGKPASSALTPTAAGTGSAATVTLPSSSTFFPQPKPAVPSVGCSTQAAQVENQANPEGKIIPAVSQ